jgi:hypothetical protein
MYYLQHEMMRMDYHKGCKTYVCAHMKEGQMWDIIHNNGSHTYYYRSRNSCGHKGWKLKQQIL